MAAEPDLSRYLEVDRYRPQITLGPRNTFSQKLAARSKSKTNMIWDIRAPSPGAVLDPMVYLEVNLTLDKTVGIGGAAAAAVANHASVNLSDGFSVQQCAQDVSLEINGEIMRYNATEILRPWSWLEAGRKGLAALCTSSGGEPDSLEDEASGQKLMPHLNTLVGTNALGYQSYGWSALTGCTIVTAADNGTIAAATARVSMGLTNFSDISKGDICMAGGNVFRVIEVMATGAAKADVRITPPFAITGTNGDQVYKLYGPPDDYDKPHMRRQQRLGSAFAQGQTKDVKFFEPLWGPAPFHCFGNTDPRDLPKGSPFRKMSRCIPHFNNATLSMSFNDIDKRIAQIEQQYAVAFAGAGGTTAITVNTTLGECNLHLRWFQYPDSYAAKIPPSVRLPAWDVTTWRKTKAAGAAARDTETSVLSDVISLASAPDKLLVYVEPSMSSFPQNSSEASATMDNKLNRGYYPRITKMRVIVGSDSSAVSTNIPAELLHQYTIENSCGRERYPYADFHQARRRAPVWLNCEQISQSFAGVQYPTQMQIEVFWKNDLSNSPLATDGVCLNFDFVCSAFNHHCYLEMSQNSAKKGYQRVSAEEAKREFMGAPSQGGSITGGGFVDDVRGAVRKFAPAAAARVGREVQYGAGKLQRGVISRLRNL